VKIYCLILARKNSTRIKNKNMIIFNGKPLIYWTLKSAVKSNVFKKIILSSDWTKLLRYSKNQFKKITPHMRSKSISKSNTASETVIRLLLKKFKIKDGYTLLLQPTSPLRKTSYVKMMIKCALKNNLMTLHSVSNVKNKTFINKKSNFFNLPSRIKSKIYLNGSIYLFSNKYFKKKNTLKEKIGNYFFHDSKYSLDLDTLKDLKKHNLKFKFNEDKVLEIISNK